MDGKMNFMKKYFTVYFVLLFCLTLCGQEIDITKYKELEKVKTAVVKIVNPSFEAGASGWKVNSRACVENGGGCVASGGLFYERTNPKEYVIAGTQDLNVIPGKAYNFSAMIRGEEIKDVGNKKIGRGGTFCIGLVGKDGKWMRGGIYPKGVRGTSDWTRIEIKNLKIPEQASGASFSFYLDRNMTGKVWFDEAKITPAESRWTIYSANTPMLQAMPGQKVKLVFGNDGKTIMNEAASGKLYAYAEWNSNVMIAPIIEDQAELQLPQEALGDGQLKVKVLDTARKLILEENEFPLTVAKTDIEAPSYCRFDSKNRVLVDGKKFLPIGVFCNANKKSELTFLKDIGFNTLMIYNATSMGFSKAPRSYKRAMEVFDYCEKKNLKIVFSIKNLYAASGRHATTSLYGDHGTDKIVRRIVSLFKDRPGLLSWYICDELPNQMIPELTARRQLLNKLDPNHPAWVLCALGYTTESMRVYGPASDALGCDAYPIHEEKSIASMVPQLEEGAQTGLPHWFTLQMFNMRRYFSKTKDHSKCRFPNENEFRAMILLAAGYGVNGYYFYTYTPLCQPDPKKDGDTKANLATVQKGIGLLNKLKPFLLSEKTVQEVPLKVRKGQVKAWQLTDDEGKSKVIVVALGPGEAEAEILIDRNKKYRSEYGLTALENGKWMFHAKDVNSDILSD